MVWRVSSIVLLHNVLTLDVKKFRAPKIQKILVTDECIQFKHIYINVLSKCFRLYEELYVTYPAIIIPDTKKIQLPALCHEMVKINVKQFQTKSNNLFNTFTHKSCLKYCISTSKQPWALSWDFFKSGGGFLHEH